MALTTKYLTPFEYSKLRGCSLQNITKHIRNNNLDMLPEVVKIKKYSRFYLLETSLAVLYFKLSGSLQKEKPISWTFKNHHFQ